jgi:nitroimidazol reductase NimA-like FMN-containing flavoprotein (pyridoxamine 5'-phosphate oxidase superfamily)
MRSLRGRDVARALRDGSVAYLAVEASRGPHITPVLFATTPDRLWFGIGRGTLKARVIAKRPSVGVLIAGTDASVVVRGRGTLVDRLTASGAELARAPFALPAFTSRNAPEMLAFARDVISEGAQLRTLVPVSVRPDSVDLLEGWSADAVLGWMTSAGPIALPAKWDPRTQRARVPAAPLRAAGGPRTSAACLCIDESDGRGPLAKRGTLLRGTGHARLRGDVATIAIDASSQTRWSGFQPRTQPVNG